MPSDRKKEFPFIADMLVMLLPSAATACFYNGFTALRVIAVCTLACVLCDAAGTLILRKSLMLKDLCAVVTGLSASMLLPPNCPLWLAALTGTVSITAGRLPFGDSERLPFTPAAVGAAFSALVYPELFFSYSAPAGSSFVTAESLTSMLRSGHSVNATAPGLLNILAGSCPGPLGTTCAFLFAACLIYLAIRRPDKFMISAGFTAVCALFAALFPRVLSGRLVSLVMELGGGMLLFSAVLLLTYPNVGFCSFPVCLLYGASGGVLCMLVRYFGSFEEGACFAVLIVNSLSPFFEKLEARFFTKRPTGGEPL